jgi:hypothetical protein
MEKICSDLRSSMTRSVPPRQTSVIKAAAQFCRSGRKNISSFLYDVENLSVLFDHVEKQFCHGNAAVDRQKLQPFAYLEGYSEI